MWKYVAKRLLWMIPIILFVAVLIFVIMDFVPGDPVTIMLGSSATQEEMEVAREEMGLNKPFLIRLGSYLEKAFFHFDLGTSYQTSTPVTQELLQRFPRTLLLSLISMLLAVCLGLPIGIYAAMHRNSAADRIAMFFSLIGVSMPSFWLGLLLVLLFSLRLGWLPAFGVGGVAYYILPALANSFGGIAGVARQSRSSVLDVLRADYVTTAQAKGLTDGDILRKHILPNSMIPVITYVGSIFGRMLGGTLVIEQVFSLPGIGNYMILAINNRDYPAVQGSVIFCAVTFSVIMLCVDLLYAAIDPRIKAQYSGKRR